MKLKYWLWLTQIPYGGVFIGMTDTDALKIDIYQIFNEL